MMLTAARFVLSDSAYVKLNRFVMSIFFGVPLVIIALFESQIAHPRARKRLQFLFGDSGPDDEDDPKIQNPDGGEDDEGEISKIPFNELVKEFPKSVFTDRILMI